jgi:taurine dioxygenase
MTAPHIEPLSPLLGAEVRDLDLARALDDDAFAAVVTAFHRYKLLRFPGQRLNEPQQIAFSQRFGELQVHVLDQFRHPQHPEKPPCIAHRRAASR